MHVFNSATDQIPLLEFVLAELLGEVFAKLPANGLDLVRAMELFHARRKSLNFCVAFEVVDVGARHLDDIAFRNWIGNGDFSLKGFEDAVEASKVLKAYAICLDGLHLLQSCFDNTTGFRVCYGLPNAFQSVEDFRKERHGFDLLR
jgi:hypothetical protein